MTIARRIHNLLHPKLGCIVMLHRVCEETNNHELRTTNSLMISPFGLEELVAGYRQRGWRFVTIDEVFDIVSDFQFSIFNFRFSPFVCFTFDDGYFDTYTTAYPVLKRLGVPFCVYMTRDFYRGTVRPQWDSEAKMMNVEQMLELSCDPLCTIGVHTCSHPRLSTLTEEGQRREIKECKDDLEQLLGRNVKHLAYPHGDYNATTVQIATEMGFKTAVTTSGRFVRDDSQPMELDRVVTF